MDMNQRRIGKYELLERLGEGSLGDLWKAFDAQQHRYVTLKIIPVHAQASADFTPRFYHEAQILAALRHPNIVPVQDFRMSHSRNEAYMIMDYVEGPSLADYLSTTAHMGNIPPPAEMVRLLTPLAAALDYAHQRHVTHGALKPAAILLDKMSATFPAPGEPKLTDFTLHQTQNPLALPPGDMPYISPEMAQGFAGTSRSDLYSLGVILYEMCTGALPFHGDTPSDILMQHIHGTPTSPALINPHIPPALTAVIMRSLAREPAARYSTATALVTMVAKALNVNMPESPSQPLPGTVNPPSWSGISGSLDLMNGPTYLSQQLRLSPSQALSVPPVGAGSQTPALPPPPVISSFTPVLPMTPTGPTPLMQRPTQAEMYLPTILAPQLPLANSASTPTPTALPGSSIPLQAPGQAAPSSTPAPPVRKRRPGWVYVALVAALLVVLAGSVFGTYLFYTRSTSPTQPPILGHAFFASSGLLSSQNSSQGITDKLQVNLQQVPDPQPGKLYYAWLLNNLSATVALGPLPLHRGLVTLSYSDPQHNNLLANYGRFLITEEAANPTPTIPSVDTTTWRYYAAFSTMPNPTDTVTHYSLFDHLKHLLSQDPKLKLVGLGGGLDIWLYRNTTKVLEAAGSARDSEKACTPDPNNEACAFIHRSLERILDYLDGSAYVQADVPPGTPLRIDPTIARVALLTSDPVNQQPPGYLKHIGSHLREITTTPGTTAAQRSLAIRIVQAINNVQHWLEAVHADASTLEKMNNTQLSGASSILNDLFTQANDAFVGQFDPSTNTVKEGVVQIHYNIQGLATFEVTPCTISNGKNTCA